ncbi:hypothetical protein AB0001_004776 [Salmonella enterica]|nr:hypothetical protein [Salmonella enterica]EEP3373012.1 hypothetical protein [Salmonella enterica]EFP6579719.1 hypothetical protein [Salmonella enterica]EGC7971002.1 hypothetical protein [Salmonella enterica]EIV4461179.1 hypothetical protein [Salmonella enterica]
MGLVYYDEVVKATKKFIFQVEQDCEGFLVTAFTYRKFGDRDYTLMSSGVWRSQDKEGLKGLACMRSRQGKKFQKEYFSS